MDEVLRKLIEVEKNAKKHQVYCNTNIEYNMDVEIIEASKEVFESYIRYKKAAETLGEKLDKQNKYYKIINAININN